jgi:competence protein ComEC
LSAGRQAGTVTTHRGKGKPQGAFHGMKGLVGMERCFSINYLLASTILGLVLGSAVPVLPSSSWLVGLAISSLILLLLYTKFRRSFVLYGAACLWGLCGAIFHGQQLYEKRLPDALAGSNWWVEAVVTGLPERTEQGERFDIRVERILQGPSTIPAAYPVKVRLSYYRERGAATNAGENFAFQPGQRWQFWVRLKPPRGFVNENSFDYEGWLLQQGYHATGYVRELARSQRLPDQECEWSHSGLRSCVDRSAFHFLQWIYERVEPEHRALFAALTIGYGEDFDRAQWDILKNTGTIHLVVVSGFHISMMAWLGYGVFVLLARIFLLPLCNIPAPVCGAVGALLSAVFYAVISGFTLPVQRALIMVLCGLAVWFFRTRVSISTGFLLACLFTFLLDPLALYSTSFWLSFGAVAILFYVFASRTHIHKTTRHQKKSFIHLWLKTQFCISIGMIPLLAQGIGSVPVNTPFANLFSVPYVTFVVLPLVILTLLFATWSEGMTSFTLDKVNYSMDFFWWILKQFEKVNHTIYFSVSDVYPILVIFLSIMGVLVVLAPRGVFTHRYLQWLLAVLLWVPLFFPWRENIPAGEFSLKVLDVGQGLSVLVKTRHHVLVYDTGDKFSDQFDIGRDLVAQQILRDGYRKINTLIISHGDSDHAGGMEGLLSVLPAGRLLSGEREGVGSRVLETCQAGQHWQVDGVIFQVLSPAAASFPRKRNNRSCVIKVSGKQHSLLLSGDIYNDQERWLLDNVPLEVLRSDVLLVPHHGSKSSSSDAFIDGVSPTIALASVGYQSRYGHPHDVVVERYRQRNIHLFRTDHSGALILSSVNHFEEIQHARWQSGRYWHRW